MMTTETMILGTARLNIGILGFGTAIPNVEIPVIGTFDGKSLIIILLLAALVLLFLLFAHYKRKSRRENRRYRDFSRRIARQKAAERETAGRRRVSMRMKQDVLERDDYTCRICGISRQFMDDLCPGLGDYLLLEIDHIESVAKGGTGKDEDNLQVLCWRCNRKKGGTKTNEEVEELIDYGIWYLTDGDVEDDEYDDEDDE
ncbi:MAG: HNH endonuclease [Lachnospiraceae bacterium]|nr:HNH endonuclease [Lachnospiraceae bacterium]